MALAFTNLVNVPPFKGGVKIGTATITFDNAYPAGGYPINAANLGTTSLINVIPAGPINAGSNLGFPVSWDRANQKLKVYATGASSGAGLAELAVATALNGLTLEVMYIAG